MRWIRLDTDWQDAPSIAALPGTTRHVLSTLWCLGARYGIGVNDEHGEPLHVKLPASYLEPVYLAQKCGLGIDAVAGALAALRGAGRLLDADDGVLVKNLGQHQAKRFRDRERELVRGDVRKGMRMIARGRSAEQPQAAGGRPHVSGGSPRQRNERTDGTNYSEPPVSSGAAKVLVALARGEIDRPEAEARLRLLDSKTT